VTTRCMPSVPSRAFAPAPPPEGDRGVGRPPTRPTAARQPERHSPRGRPPLPHSRGLVAPSRLRLDVCDVKPHYIEVSASTRLGSRGERQGSSPSDRTDSLDPVRSNRGHAPVNLAALWTVEASGPAAKPR